MVKAEDTITSSSLPNFVTKITLLKNLLIYIFLLILIMTSLCNQTDEETSPSIQ